MEPLQIKVLHPASLLVQLPEGYKDFLIKAESKKKLLYSQEEHLQAVIMGGTSHLDSQH